MAIYKVKVAQVKEISARNGSKFNAYKTIDKNGNFIDLKFTKACHNVPETRCWIYVLEENFNIQRNREYPVMWVKEVEKVEPLVATSSNVSDYFDPEPEPAAKKPETAFTPF